MGALYYLGIDGGGTKTTFALANSSGEIIKTVKKGGTNPNDIGLSETGRILSEGIEECIEGHLPCEISVFAGISGGGVENNKTEIHKFLSEFGFFSFGNGSDLMNVSACLEDKKKIILITGTGFSVIAVNGTEEFRIGGWGQLFDAGGCGYTIGRDAIYAALREFDGSGRKTALRQMIEAQIGEGAEAHLLKFYAGGKRYIASFAPFCFEGYRQGDSVSKEIIDSNAKFIADNLKVAYEKLGKCPVRVLVSGGLVKDSDILFPEIEKYLDEAELTLIKLDENPVRGAIIRAMS